MIIAVAASRADPTQRKLILGLTAQNITRMEAGEPIDKEMADYGLPGWSMTIVAAVTDQALVNMLRPGFGAAPILNDDHGGVHNAEGVAILNAEQAATVVKAMGIAVETQGEGYVDCNDCDQLDVCPKHRADMDDVTEFEIVRREIAAGLEATT